MLASIPIGDPEGPTGRAVALKDTLPRLGSKSHSGVYPPCCKDGMNLLRSLLAKVLIVEQLIIYTERGSEQNASFEE